MCNLLVAWYQGEEKRATLRLHVQGRMGQVEVPLALRWRFE
jgi:hypothetical protein